MEDEQDDVQFLESLLSKTSLPFHDFYGETTFDPTVPHHNYEEMLSPSVLSRADSLPVGRTGTPLDYFPWDSLSPIETNTKHDVQEALGQDRMFSPDEFLLQDAEKMTEIVGRFFDVGETQSCESGDGQESSLVSALEANRKYKSELLRSLRSVEVVANENKQNIQKVIGIRKKVWAAQKGHSLKPANTVGSLQTSLLNRLGIDPEEAYPILDELSQMHYCLRKEYKELALKEKSSKWSSREMQLLEEGVKRANQKSLLEKTLLTMEGQEARARIAEIQNTPTEELLSNVEGLDWEFIAASFLHGARTAKDCQIQWTVNQHPLINTEGVWKKAELDALKALVDKHGIYGKWIEIASELGTNRSASQCLSIYQRRLNKSLLKGRWSPEEDAQLIKLVQENITIDEEINWTRVTTRMEGRTPTQCFHRFYKNLDPSIKRGRWTSEEDELLRLGTSLHGRDWYLVCRWVPNRTDMQCRERWMNVLDPEIKTETFTPEEDAILLEAVEEAGGPGSWASIQSKHFPERTDNQLRRRYNQLCLQKTDGATEDQSSRPRKQVRRPRSKRACASVDGVVRKKGRPRKNPEEPPKLSKRVLKRIGENFQPRQSQRRVSPST